MVGILKQLFTSFSTAQIAQIKGKSFSIKLITSNVLEAFLFRSNGLSGKENALIIKSAIEYIIIRESPYSSIQKQPSRGILKKRCCENMLQIYRRTPMSKWDFDKATLQPY